MKIYIAGKITGLPWKKTKRKFSEAEKKLRKHGHKVFNPFAVAEVIGKDWEYNDYMEIGYSAIELCDAIYFLPDWTDSVGAVKEYIHASKHNKITIFDEKCKENHPNHHRGFAK